MVTLIQENPTWFWIGLGIALLAVYVIIRLVKKIVNKVIAIIVAIIIGVGGGGYASIGKTLAEYGDNAAKAGLTVTEYIQKFVN